MTHRSRVETRTTPTRKFLGARVRPTRYEAVSEVISKKRNQKGARRGQQSARTWQKGIAVPNSENRDQCRRCLHGTVVGFSTNVSVIVWWAGSPGGGGPVDKAFTLMGKPRMLSNFSGNRRQKMASLERKIKNCLEERVHDWFSAPFSPRIGAQRVT